MSNRGIPNFDFTARDWDSNLEALIELVRIREPEKWTSLFDGDLGRVLLEAMAYNTTLLSYSADAHALESFIDTLRLRESATHFAALTSYQIRRGTVASVEAYAVANRTPPSGKKFRIRKGTKIVDKIGQPWEIARDYTVEDGYQTPVEEIFSYGDIKGRLATSNGVLQDVKALLKLEPGSAVGVLTNSAGERFDSAVNFTSRVGKGQILRLGAEWSNNAFGSPPPPQLDEYAIVDTGRYDYDLHPNSIIYLDRPWAGASTWIGKWAIESRSILLQQGEAKSETFTAPSVVEDRIRWTVSGTYYPVAMGSLEGVTPSGASSTSHTAVPNSGISVTINGILWRETRSLLFETPDALAYQVRFDELDKPTVMFGDGLFGAMIPESAVVRVSYRIGGGARGNITQNSLDTAIAVQTDTGDTAQVYLSNPYTVGRGGQDRETLQEIKRNIPKHVRANDRAVTVEDYSSLASNFVDAVAGRIKLAKGVLHKNLVPREQNIVWVYAWVEGSAGQLAAPSMELKQRLLDYLNARKMVTDEVVIVDGKSTPVPVEVRYCVEKWSDRVVARQKVQSAINAVFARMTPGTPLRLSALYEAVEALNEVKFCQFTHPKRDVIPSNEFELFYNPMQFPAETRLAAPVARGESTVTVEDGSIFYPQGIITIYETGKVPTAAVVSSITGNVVTLRHDITAQDNYSLDAFVSDSAYFPQDWQFERPVDLFISYAAGNATSTLITESIIRKLKIYFSETLRPEEPLSRVTLQLLLRSIPNISTSDVRLHSIDGVSEQVVPSSSEKITLGVLSINNEVF